MEHTYTTQDNTLFLIGIVILIFFAIIIFWVTIVIPLAEQRDYIKMEMQRSTSETEYNYWEKELKKLYLRYIPIIGKFIK